jgi:transcriptional regulator with XRE-family HTH domain
MGNRKRWPLDFEARRRLSEQMIREGAKARAARRRRRLTQHQLGDKAGLSQSAVSDVEIGAGASLSLVAWQRLAIVLDLRFKIELGRDALEEPIDAGHLAIQEMVMRIGRDSGRRRTFELPTKPSEPSRSTDVGLTDEVLRALILMECWNTFGNVNASIRSSDRKRADAEALAIALGGERPYTVHQCWVVRATRRNRELIARYPELFASRFPGSSREWVAALTRRERPPSETRLVWCDVACTRVFEWRARVRA